MNNKNDYKTTKLPQQGSIFFDDDEFEPVQQAKPAEKPSTASGNEEWRMHFASFGAAQVATAPTSATSTRAYWWTAVWNPTMCSRNLNAMA
ncbi:MAG: hypothetical protein L6U16_11495 [Porphyromonadaceae bacterium]|nr:MAG: hypothetical protein L6U16_11495 [Porphyromonadaceae bacterium]